MKKLILMIMLSCYNYGYGYEIATFAPPANPVSEQPTTVIRYTQPNSKDMIIFIPGGEGHYILPKHPIDDSKGFLALLKSISASSGADVSIVISPYPLKVSPSTWYPYMRDTDDHLGRIESIVRQYQNTHNIWLMGHSNGTSSITTFVHWLEKRNNIGSIKGLIMASTRDVAQFDRSPELPVLFVHHVKDACRATPFDTAQRNFVRVQQINSHKTEFVAVDSDIPTTWGDPCNSGYHLLRGTDAETTSAIVNFMKESK